MSDTASGTWTLPAWPGLRLAVAPRVALLAIAAAMVATIAVKLVMLAVPAPVRPEPAPAAPPVWLAIRKPVQVYSLQSPDLAKAPLTYGARRLSVGETREDVLAFGDLGAGAPALRLEITRHGSPLAATLFTTIARQAAKAGLSVEHSGLPDLLPTRFGSFEIADVTLASGAGRTGLDAPCSGFRLAVADPALTLAGIACGWDRTPSHRALGCLIDRLDLASGGEDRALIDFFAATDLHRDAACRGMRLGPDETHAAWLDDTDEPHKTATPRKKVRRR